MPRWIVAATVCVTMVAFTAVSACSSPKINCPVTTSPLYEPAGQCLRFGVSTPSGPLQPGEIAAVTELVGVAPSVNLSFHDFTAIPPIAALDAVTSTGAEAVITWEPWRHLGGDRYDTESFTMSSIVAGVHDDYLYRWADELTAWGSTVYLRFAHEPNGDWYPWSPSGGTSPEVYIAAWRHVHDLFTSKGATNVKWVWAPNVPLADDTPLARWYPGDGYVDVFGIDGYNWGTSEAGHRWTKPRDLFEPSLRQLRALAGDRPLMVTEVGSAEEGGSKADWIEELVSYLDDVPGVSGFIWFDHNKEADWRLNSTPEAAAAMARALKEAGL